jgi:hypothetical protein
MRKFWKVYNLFGEIYAAVIEVTLSGFRDTYGNQEVEI